MAGVSDTTLDAMDEEIHRITDECFTEARRLLRENREKLDRIVQQLLAHETLDEAEVYAAAGIPEPAATRIEATEPAGSAEQNNSAVTRFA